MAVCGDYEEDVTGFYGAVFQWWKIDRLLKENKIVLLGNQSECSKEKHYQINVQLFRNCLETK